MKRLIIARHGNTFTADQTPTRVGCHTDLPLVEEALGRQIGQYLRQQQIILSKVYAAPLKRTLQTAQLILAEAGQALPVEPLADFLEIDYGPDEDKPEAQVIERLGRHALARQGDRQPTPTAIIDAGSAVIERWNRDATVPDGWQVDVGSIITTWQNFADQIADNETVLVVTSNGIIRFAPHILDAADYQQFIGSASLKVKTGSLSIFEKNQYSWQCRLWNQRPV
ncbi:histidine phosphatase family protein [Utexia brackfieldae]|uniref:histidine phosphatase family protein n=1 Tax=Utexia brackfieldae TaxID=3074108 RepID=UPI00370D8C52